jgi:hypothetical protein
MANLMAISPQVPQSPTSEKLQIFWEVHMEPFSAWLGATDLDFGQVFRAERCRLMDHTPGTECNGE